MHRLEGLHHKKAPLTPALSSEYRGEGGLHFATAERYTRAGVLGPTIGG